MQHAAITQDDEPLIETISVGCRIAEYLAPPAGNRFIDFSSQEIVRDRPHQGVWRRSAQCDPLVANDSTNDKGIAVVRPNQLPSAVIQIPELRTWHGRLPQDIPREVRPLQMPGPLRLQLVHFAVHGLQRLDQVWLQLGLDRDDEVDITVFVEVAHGKRACRYAPMSSGPRIARILETSSPRTSL